MEQPRQLADFRADVRDWLAAHAPRVQRPQDIAAAAAFDVAWQQRQYAAGWAGIAWPREYGGRGLSLIEQIIWHEEYARAGAPYLGINYVGINHAGPTLMACGTAAQKAAHLQPILAGAAMWCQGFSEPGAGSDLASLRMRGVVDGDALVVSGQKIWTSYAQFARYQELLVRTDPTAPRHRGLTWIIGDMLLPGIEVRPIRALTGEAEFCAVFYDEVRIPLGNIVGGLNGGWQVAMATLGFERGTGFIPFQIKLSATVEALVAQHRAQGGGAALEEDLALARAEVAALRAMTYTAVARAGQAGAPGAEGSIVALYYGELSQRIHRLALRVAGAESLDMPAGSWGLRQLDTLKDTIGGGTSEVRRNIIAERVLGLPR